jgi:hypothetical protein
MQKPPPHRKQQNDVWQVHNYIGLPADSRRDSGGIEDNREGGLTVDEIFSGWGAGWGVPSAVTSLSILPLSTFFNPLASAVLVSPS